MWIEVSELNVLFCVIITGNDSREHKDGDSKTHHDDDRRQQQHSWWEDSDVDAAADAADVSGAPRPVGLLRSLTYID